MAKAKVTYVDDGKIHKCSQCGGEVKVVVKLNVGNINICRDCVEKISDSMFMGKSYSMK